jgi:2-(1,2-epoxy-1,2-dihydrophenyl)acetyl-CoA isomerase
LDQETVRIERNGRIQWVHFSRPDRLNVFGVQMGADLLKALEDGERSAEVSCLVLTGEGEAFCAGEDLDVGGSAAKGGRPVLLGEALSRGYNSVVQRIKRMAKPVVAAVNGVTAGVGLGLAMACDLRAASERATFREALVDTSHASSSWAGFWLPRILGPGKAMEVGAARKPIDARAALSLGLVDRVFPGEGFFREVANVAGRLAERPVATLALTKRTLNRAVAVGPTSALEYEVYLRALAGMAQDARTRGAS